VLNALELVAVGLDHTTAGIELRERLAFAEGDLCAALGQLTGPSGGPLEVIASPNQRRERCRRRHQSADRKAAGERQMLHSGLQEDLARDDRPTR
jgi:hypothetical protein